MGGLKFDYNKMEITTKLAVNRATIHKKKRIEMSAKDKKEIATLLEQGKDALARVKVNSVIFSKSLIFWLLFFLLEKF